MEKLYEQAIAWIKQHSEGRHGDAAELMRKAQASKPSWYKLLQGKGVRAENLLEWLGNLGFRLIPPDESPNLPAPIQPDSDDQRSLLDKIAQLERELEEKDRRLAEFIQYKHRWEGLMEIKKMEANVQAQAQQQKSLLFSSDPSSCAGKEPESSEPLGREVHGPPEHGDSVRG